MSEQSSRIEGRRGRIAKACAQCRLAKTRCAFTEGGKACDKCLQRGLECTMLPQGPPTKSSSVVAVARGPGPSGSSSASGAPNSSGASGASGAPSSSNGSGPGSGVGSGSRSDAASDALSPKSNASSTSRGFEDSPGANSLHSGFGGTGAFGVPGSAGPSSGAPGSRPQLLVDTSDSSKTSSATKDAFSPASIHYQASNSSGSADQQRFDSPMLNAEAFPELAAFTSHEPMRTPLPDRSMSLPIANPMHGSLDAMSGQMMSSMNGSMAGSLPNSVNGSLDGSMHGGSVNGSISGMPTSAPLSSSVPSNFAKGLSGPLASPPQGQFGNQLGANQFTNNQFNDNQYNNNQFNNNQFGNQLGGAFSQSFSSSLSAPLNGPVGAPAQFAGQLGSPLDQTVSQHLEHPLHHMNQPSNQMDTSEESRYDPLEGGFGGGSPMQIETTGEYFLNLGVFPEAIPEAQAARQLSPLQPDFNFQNSAAAMVFQAIDPVLHDHLGAMSRLLNPARRLPTRNVVNQRILSYRQVVRLFSFFKSNYNHWISLPDAEPEELANFLLEQCPLLVTTCCCIALRFGSAELWQTTYPSLVRYLTYELAQTLVSIPQTTECLQALTILAKYADTLTYGGFVFDMWYISGVGIQHLLAVAALGGSFTYVHMRLWNHLMLAHLSSANTSGRAVMVGEREMQTCRLVLDQGLATRFDSCMVAEIMVHWLTIQYLSQHKNIELFDKGLTEWQEEWGMLAQLPMIQFIEPVLLFCTFLVRWTQHLRVTAEANESEDPDQPSSPQSDDLSYRAANGMSTETLFEELENLGVVINSLLNMVHSDFFGCLSDSLHCIGFVSGIMALVISKTLIDRGETVQDEQKEQLTTCVRLVSQLSQRFLATSRGQDVFRTRCVALTQLLKSNPFF